MSKTKSAIRGSRHPKHELTGVNQQGVLDPSITSVTNFSGTPDSRRQAGKKAASFEPGRVYCMK